MQDRADVLKAQCSSDYKSEVLTTPSKPQTDKLAQTRHSADGIRSIWSSSMNWLVKATKGSDRERFQIYLYIFIDGYYDPPSTFRHLPKEKLHELVKQQTK